MSDQEIEYLVYEAFRRAGAFMPQTPDEVMAEEADFDESEIELPESLKDPMAILKRRTDD